jgi:hypothetical protein
VKETHTALYFYLSIGNQRAIMQCHCFDRREVCSLPCGKDHLCVISKVAIINFTIWKGNTGMVVLCCRVGRVCQLIAAGISINSWDSEDSKNTPLHWAACYGNKDIVTCLIGGYSKSCCTHCH